MSGGGRDGERGIWLQRSVAILVGMFEAAELTGPSARCKQCMFTDAVDGQYCRECLRSRCEVCGFWEEGMHRCHADRVNADGTVEIMWHCSVCRSLPSYLQHHLVAVNHICRTASFYVWHGVPDNGTADDIKTAKAKLRVRQPAHVAPWLYVGLDKL